MNDQDLAAQSQSSASQPSLTEPSYPPPQVPLGDEPAPAGPAPDRPGPLAILMAGAGSILAIGAMELFSARASYPLAVVPFATSIVLVMGDASAKAAQPRAVFGGHIVSTLVGLAVLDIAGPTPVAAAIAVGLAIMAMHLTRTFHPPAGIDPLVVVLNAMPALFLLVPVAAGAAMLVALAYLWHNLVCRRRWPQHWW